MSNLFFCIQDVDIYDGVDQQSLEEVARLAAESILEKDKLLYSPNQPAEYIYVLKEGEVEIYRIENGKKIVLETLYPGDIFGDFGTQQTKHFAVTKRKSYVCKTPKDKFIKVLEKHPEITLKLIEALADKTLYYEDRLALQSRPAKDRVLEELKFIKSKSQKNIFGKIFKIPLRISHQRLAEKVGLNRVTVTKLIGELKEEGRIAIDPNTNEIKILDED